MTRFDRFLKRTFDVVGSVAGLVLAGPIIVIAALVARWDTQKSGLFRQTRVGLHGWTFQLLKIRTMRDVPGITTTVTTGHDPRITWFGGLLRRTKIDELPQLINVLRGEMSFVGPRPDVPAQIDELADQDRVILTVRPGITGPASLKYRNEESLLAGQADPERFNREVIFPDKVRINRQYLVEYTFWQDLKYLWWTIFDGEEQANQLPDPPQLIDQQGKSGSGRNQRVA